jgi:branched-chain amino acid transport system permease protein
MPFADDRRMAGPMWVYCISVVVAAVLFVFASNFVRSRPGRALVALKDNDASALALGVNVSLYRAAAFGVSAMYGGIAGSLLMMDQKFATDAQFGIRMAIFLVVGVVVGGSGTISGAIPGAFVYLFVPHFVSEWTFDQDGMPFGLRQIANPLFDALRPGGISAVGFVFGLTLLLLMFVLPGGFISGMRMLRARVVRVVPNPAWLRQRGSVES